MTETIINLETVNPIEFFGVNNGKLDILKKKFPLLKILSRGTQIKLSGSPEQIEHPCLWTEWENGEGENRKSKATRGNDRQERCGVCHRARGYW